MTLPQLNALPDAQLNRLVAQRCGFFDIGKYKSTHGNRRDQPGGAIPIPNYAGSLDAMHEAEKGLTVLQCFAYKEMLFEQTNPNREPVKNTSFLAVCATARQRAIAFLLATGAGEEGEPS